MKILSSRKHIYTMALTNKHSTKELKRNYIQRYEMKNPFNFNKAFILLIKTLPINKKYSKKQEILSRNNIIKQKVKAKIFPKAKKYIKKKPNIEKNSYSNRFLLKKNRKLYKKTIIVSHKKSLSSSIELDFILNKIKAIKREERRYFFREKFQNISRNTLLSTRTPKNGKVFLTFVRKNCFSQVAQFLENENKWAPLSKFSCGSLGFRNKKKTTEYASEQTIKAVGKFLTYSRFTNIDVVFTSNIPYFNKKILNNIIPNPLYIRSISLNHNRPHSYVRRPKTQRK